MESQFALLTLICQLLVSDNGQDALGGLHGSALFGGLGSSYCVHLPASSFKPLLLLLVQSSNGGESIFGESTHRYERLCKSWASPEPGLLKTTFALKKL